MDGRSKSEQAVCIWYIQRDWSESISKTFDTIISISAILIIIIYYWMPFKHHSWVRNLHKQTHQIVKVQSSFDSNVRRDFVTQWSKHLLTYPTYRLIFIWLMVRKVGHLHILQLLRSPIYSFFHVPSRTRFLHWTHYKKKEAKCRVYTRKLKRYLP